MKNKTAQIIGFLTLIFAVMNCGFGGKAGEIRLAVPEEGGTVNLNSEAQQNYQPPDRRGWETPYDPQSVKNGEKDTTRPVPVSFQWEADMNESVRFVIRISENPSLGNALEFETAENGQNVQNLKPETTYYWQVCAKSGDQETKSEIRSFTTLPVLSRWFDLPGATNIRDAGGWKAASGKRMKRGMVFRGSELDRNFSLTPESKQFMTETLGIKTDLDLRRVGEWTFDGVENAPLAPEAQWVSTPVLAYSDGFTPEQMAAYRKAFEVLAQAETYPVYIHCMGGADRTGMVVMGLQSILGVSDNNLCTDYELTSFAPFGIRSIHTDYFQATLQKLAEYSSVDEPLSVKWVNFLLACGVTPEEMEQIRGILLEEDN